MAVPAADEGGVGSRVADVALDLCPDPLVAVDGDGRIAAINPALCDLVGPDPGSGPAEVDDWWFVDPADRALLDAQVRDALAGHIAAGRIQLISRDGAAVPVEVSWRPVAPTGRVRALGLLRPTGSATDVAGVSGLRDRQFRDLFATAGVAIAIADLDGRIVDANPACLAILGYTRTELRQLDVMTVIHPDDRPASRDQLTALLAGQVESYVVDRRYLTRTGQIVWGQTSVSLVHDDTGVPVHVAAIVQDVTATRTAQAQLERSLALQRLAGSLARVGGWSLDADGLAPTLSPAMYEILELAPGQEPPFAQALDLIAPDDQPRATAAIQACLTQGTPFELDLAMDTLTGRRLAVRAIGEPQRDTDGTIVGVMGAFQDITRLKAANNRARKARHALQDQELELQRQAALLDEAQDAILVRDLDGRVTFWNRGAQRIYGWSAAEVLGAHVRELLYDDPGEFDRVTAQVLRHGSWIGQLAQHDRSGERVVVACRWTLLHDEDGHPDAVLAINTDVTQWQKVEQQLLRAQRMESIGFLASGVAHDLNNILSPILLACDLLRHRDGDTPNRDVIELIESSVHHGTDLVAQILSFARGVEGERTAVDITTLLDDLAGIIGDTFPKNIDLHLDTPDGVPGLVADATQIQQVLLNLAVNARDAMPDGGTLTIRAQEAVLDAQYVAATAEVIPGDYLIIEVEDTGTGMPPDVRDRIFEPFFTTKPHGAGTGLGLSTSQAIATSHGGFLQVYSDPGRGSRFRLYLPLRITADDPDTPTGEPAVDLPRGAGQTVLVVDDEQRIRAMASQTLRAHGYQTLQADNGAKAVSLFAQYRGVIDVVILDMMMPVMDGPATIHALRDINPDVHLIGTSGLHSDAKTTGAATAGVAHFLPKPYTARALLETLQTVLTPTT